MSRFRDFLYLDDRAVTSLLSGAEGGEYESTSERYTQSNEQSDTSDSAYAPREVSSSSSTERERIVRQNAEARFSRLWDLISSDDQEAVVEYSKESNESLLTRTDDGVFCRLEGRLSLPPFAAMLAASGDLQRISNFAEKFGLFTPDADMAEKFEAMSVMRDLLKETFPVVLTVGNSEPAIALPLDAQYSRVRLDQYMGRATVFGRVLEIVPRGSKYRQLQIPGAAHFPEMTRQQRRQAERSGETDSHGIDLRGPVLVVRVIAIYQ